MLQHFTTITVPSTIGVSEQLSPDFHRLRASHVAKYLTHKFGGCTITEGVGYYKAEDESIVVEPVIMVTAWHNGNDADVSSFCSNMCRIWEQECVAVTTDKGMDFIYPNVYPIGG